MDPAARADESLKLSEDRKQGPWHYTFVNNKGYKDFRSIDKAWDVNLWSAQEVARLLVAVFATAILQRVCFIR